jgi:hypothetical protein
MNFVVFGDDAGFELRTLVVPGFPVGSEGVPVLGSSLSQDLVEGIVFVRLPALSVEDVVILLFQD